MLVHSAFPVAYSANERQGMASESNLMAIHCSPSGVVPQRRRSGDVSERRVFTFSGERVSRVGLIELCGCPVVPEPVVVVVVARRRLGTL